MHLLIFQLNAQLILTGVNKHKDKVRMYNNSIPLVTAAFKKKINHNIKPLWLSK